MQVLTKKPPNVPQLPELSAPPPRMRSVTRTIRMDHDVDGMITDIAEHGNYSTNHIVSRALRRFGEYEVHAERFGFVSMSMKALAHIVEHLSAEDARMLGREFGEKIIPEFIVFTYKNFNYANVVKTMEMFGQRYSRMYVFDQSVDRNGTDTLIFKHEQGTNMSLYIAEAMVALLARLNLGTMVSQTDGQIVIKVEKNKVGKMPLTRLQVN